MNPPPHGMHLHTKSAIRTSFMEIRPKLVKKGRQTIDKCHYAGGFQVGSSKGCGTPLIHSGGPFLHLINPQMHFTINKGTTSHYIYR